MLAAPRPEPIRQSEEVLFVDRIQHHHDRTLDNLVLQRRNRQRALASIRLRDEPPPRWLRPVRPPMDPLVQVPDLAVEVCLVVLPRQSIRSGGSVLPQCVERRPQHPDINVVEERGEPFLLPFPCSFPYAVQPL